MIITDLDPGRDAARRLAAALPPGERDTQQTSAVPCGTAGVLSATPAAGTQAATHSTNITQTTHYNYNLTINSLSTQQNSRQNLILLMNFAPALDAIQQRNIKKVFEN